MDHRSNLAMTTAAGATCPANGGELRVDRPSRSPRHGRHDFVEHPEEPEALRLAQPPDPIGEVPKGVANNAALGEPEASG